MQDMGHENSPSLGQAQSRVHPGRQLQSRLTTTKSGRTVVMPWAELHARLTLVQGRGLTMSPPRAPEHTHIT